MPKSIFSQFTSRNTPITPLIVSMTSSGVDSFSVASGDLSIPVLASGPGSTDLGFKPLFSVKVQGYDVPSTYGVISLNTAMSRIRWDVMTITQVNTPTPPPIHFFVRATHRCQGDTFWSGVYTAPTWTLGSTATGGMIVQLTGILCDQFELWGRIDPVDAPGIAEVHFTTSCIADRLGSKFETVLGENTV